jgi:hypothetical protein
MYVPFGATAFLIVGTNLIVIAVVGFQYHVICPGVNMEYCRSALSVPSKRPAGTQAGSSGSSHSSGKSFPRPARTPWLTRLP